MRGGTGVGEQGRWGGRTERWEACAKDTQASALVHVRPPRAQSLDSPATSVESISATVTPYSQSNTFASSGANLPSSFPATPPSYPRRINAFLSDYHISPSDHTLPTLRTAPGDWIARGTLRGTEAGEGNVGEPR